MSRKLILLVIMLSLLFPGCWDQKLIEQIGIVLQVGIESSPNNKLLITAMFPAIDSKLKNQDEIVTVEANLIRESRERLRMTASKVIEGGKIQQILFSKEIAVKGIQSLLEVFERDPINPPLAYVVIVDGSPKELLEKAQTFKSKPRAVFYINQLLVNNVNTSYIPETRIYDFNIQYLAPGLDPITPMIKLESNGIRILGSALFEADKMVGEIDTQQTAFLLAMMGQLKKTEFIFNPSSLVKGDQLKKGIAVAIKGGRRKIQIKIKDQQPVINISLDFKGSLDEYRRDTLDDVRLQKKIEKQLSGEIKRACLEIVKYTQRIGSDPIGIGDLVRAKYPSDWKRMNGKDVYQDAKVNVKVNLDIIQFGSIK